MKKIAIFTWYNDDRNCGQTLQAYALQKAIEKKNAIPIIITYRNDARKKIYRNRFLYPIRRYLRMNYKMRKRQKVFDYFIKEYMRVSSPLYNKKQVQQYLADSNIKNLLIGSDQVWNPQRELDDIYIGKLEGNYCKSSYAPSMMQPDLEIKYKKELLKVGKCINEFKYISVREKSAKEMLQKYVEQEVENVLDPVFLIEKEEWENLENKEFLKRESNYILVYCLGETEKCREVVSEAQNALKEEVSILYIDVEDNYDIPNDWRRIENVGPREFITLIHNAAFICCDSFHGTVFSIIFNKNFVVVPSKRKTFSSNMYRVTDLLDLLGLSERYITNSMDCKLKIEYLMVNRNLNYEKNVSWEYLEEIIEHYL